MQTAWTNLAKTGSPNPGNQTGAGAVQWPAFSESLGLQHLIIDEAPSVATDYGKCAFWDSLPKQINYPH